MYKSLQQTAPQRIGNCAQNEPEKQAHAGSGGAPLGGLQATVASAIGTMRQSSDVSDKVARYPDSARDTSGGLPLPLRHSPSRGATHTTADGSSDAGGPYSAARSVDVMDAMWDSDASWGFVRDPVRSCFACLPISVLYFCSSWLVTPSMG